MPKDEQRSKNSKKQKKKQDLSQLVTDQQEKLYLKEKKQTSKGQSRGKNSFSVSDSEDEDLAQKQIFIDQIRETDADRLSSFISKLIAKNKINAKNAFQVPLIQLNQTQNYNQIDQIDEKDVDSGNSWRKISSSLQNNNKIYGYRVDATHNFTHKMLQIVSRDQQSKPEESQLRKKWKEEPLTLNTQFFSDNTDDNFTSCIQKNLKNINLSYKQAVFTSHPLIQITRRKFDQQDLKGLFMAKIQMSDKLQIQIDANESRFFKRRRQKKQIGLDEQEQQLSRQIFEVEGRQQTQKKIQIFGIISETCQIDYLLDNIVNQVPIKRQNYLDQFQTIWKQLDEETHHETQVLQQRKNKSIEVESSGQNNVVKKEVEEGKQSHKNSLDQAQDNKEIKQSDLCEIDVAQQERQVLNKLDENNQEQKHNQHPLGAEDKLMNNQIRITNYLNLKSVKLTSKNDVILHQLSIEDEVHEAQRTIELWKGQSKPVKQRRVRKKKQEQPDPVNFNSEFINNKRERQKYKKDVINLDKYEQKQMKILIKNLKDIQKEHICDINILNKYTKTAIFSQEPSLFRKTQIDIERDQNISDQNIAVINLLGASYGQLGISKRFQIKNIKQTIRKYIFEQNMLSFAEIYKKYTDQENLVSPALCFLTLLHIAVECNLELTQQNGWDIKVIQNQRQQRDENAL